MMMMVIIILMCKYLPQLIVLQLLIAMIDMRITQPSMKRHHVSCTALLHTERELVKGLNG